MREAVQRLIDLARAENKPDNVKKWQAAAMRLKTKRELADAALDLARRGHWKEASEGFAKAIQLSPDGHWAWFNQACLLAYLEDVEGYRRHCKAMWNEFGNTDNLTVAEPRARPAFCCRKAAMPRSCWPRPTGGLRRRTATRHSRGGLAL